MKKNLDTEIMEGIYRFEKKRLKKSLLMYILGFSIIVSSTIFLVWSVIRILNEQQTFSILEIFSEDIEIIKGNYSEVLEILSFELPLKHIILIILGIILLGALLIIYMRNRSIISTKLSIIKKYFK